MRKFYTLIFAWLLLPTIAGARKQGQAHLDSLLEQVPKMKDDTNTALLYDLISSNYAGINSDEGLKWAEKELEFSRKIGWRRGESNAYNSFGQHLEAKGAYPAALEAYFKSLAVLEDAKDKYAIGVVTCNIGLLYSEQKDYTKALEWDFRALKLANELNDSLMMKTVTGNIGIVYQNQGENEQSLKYQLMSLHIAEASRDKNVGAQYIDIGGTYQNMKQYAAALAYTFKGIKVAEALGYKRDVAAALGNVGENYYLIATGVAPPQPDSLVPATRAANLSQAVNYLRQGIAACRNMHFLAGIVEFCPYLSNALTAQGDYKGALAAYKEYIGIKDSLFNIANTENIANLETKRAVALKDKDIQIAKLAVAKKRNERVFYISGIILLLIIIAIIVYNFRRREHDRKRIKDLQDHKISLLDEAVKRRTEQLGSMRQTIATDFHDQTGNMLAAITRQAATLELKLLHQPDVLPTIRSIITNSNELYASSKDFLWNLNHDSDDPFILFQYLSGYGQRFYNQFDISFLAFVNGEEQPQMQLHPFAGLNLIYIFKEAMSNVIKHSGADEVSMELRWEVDRAVYSLQDNGAWKQADEHTEHYGLNNMERRSCQSGFDYKLSHDTTGTRVEISVPISADYIKNQ